MIQIAKNTMPLIQQVFEKIKQTKNYKLYTALYLFSLQGDNCSNNILEIVLDNADQLNQQLNFDIFDENNQQQLLDKINPNMEITTDERILNFISEQIVNRNNVFNKAILYTVRDNLCYVLSQYSKDQLGFKISQQGLDNLSIQTVGDLSEIKLNDAQIIGMLKNGKIVVNAISKNPPTYKVLDTIEINAKTISLFQAEINSIVKTTSKTKHLINDVNVLRKDIYLYQKNAVSTQQQFYLYVPNSLIYGGDKYITFGLWQDDKSAFEFKIISNYGVVVPYLIEYNNPTVLNSKTLYCLTNRNELNQHRKVAKIEICECIDNVKDYKNNGKSTIQNNIFIQLTLDSSNSNFNFNCGQKLDDLGLSKYKKKEEFLYNDNFKKYEQWTNDLNNINKSKIQNKIDKLQQVVDKINNKLQEDKQNKLYLEALTKAQNQLNDAVIEKNNYKDITTQQMIELAYETVLEERDNQHNYRNRQFKQIRNKLSELKKKQGINKVYNIRLLPRSYDEILNNQDDANMIEDQNENKYYIIASTNINNLVDKCFELINNF